MAHRYTMNWWLARAKHIDGVEDVAKQFKDRFGALPEPVENLLYMVGIKVLATKLGVESIYTQGKQVVLSLAHGKGPANLSLHQEYKDAIKVGAKQLRLDSKRLGSKWQEGLKNLLEEWCNLAQVDQAL